jgi:hypothetical protein
MLIKYWKIFIYFIILVILFIPSRGYSQTLDYPDNYPKQHIIAVLPVDLEIRDIYGDSTRYAANQFADQIRKIPGIESLNVLSSIRKIYQSDARLNYKSISEAIRESTFPDPSDLYKVAQTLNADRIILVSGGFDTQKDLLYRSIGSYFNIFNNYKIKPEYKYKLYISLYDPVSGNLEWSQTYQKKFIFRDFYLAAPTMSTNPSFTGIFNKYLTKITTDTGEKLYHHFYNVETTTVQSEIITNTGITGEAKDGVMTTDGPPLINQTASPDKEAPVKNTGQVIQPVIPIPMPNYSSQDTPPILVQPVTQDKAATEKTENINQVEMGVDDIETEESDLNTPYKELSEPNENPINRHPKDLSTLKPNYEEELLKNYRERILQKY